MIKKLLSCFCAMMLLFSTTPIYAASEDLTPSYDEIKIIDEITLIDDDGVYYRFKTMDERNQFLRSLNLENRINTRGCFTGDVGYPNCNSNSNTVVRIETKIVSKTVTNYIPHKKLMLESWTDGGAYGASMSVTTGITLGFNISGISLSVSTGSSQTLTVPKRKFGNIKYKAKFTITTKQQYLILKNGKKQKGTQYKTVSKKESAFYGVYK